jgi:hypothetical protein
VILTYLEIHETGFGLSLNFIRERALEGTGALRLISEACKEVLIHQDYLMINGIGNL